MKINGLILSETVIIIILTISLIILERENDSLERAKEGTGLLSPRVYAGLIQPQNHMIFNYDPLNEKILDFLEQNKINASIYVANLRDGAWTGINEEKQFYPASLNKLFLAMLIMRKIERKELSFETIVPVLPEDHDATDLQPTKEKELPLKEVLERMLKKSDNTAANMLKHYIADDDITPFLFYLDYYERHEGNKTQEALVGMNSIANVFSSLYFSTLLEPENSEYILSLLTETVFDIKKVANLPENVTVAHKFGNREHENIQEFNDCGIIYIDKSRMFYCIAIKGLDTEQAITTVGFVVNKIYTYVVAARAEFQSTKW